MAPPFRCHRVLMNEDTSEVGSVRLTPPDGIHPVAFIPDFELRTAAARAARRDRAPGDASFNVARDYCWPPCSRACSRRAGGQFLHSLLMEATRDRLHQSSVKRDGTILALVDWLRGAGFKHVITVLSSWSPSAPISAGCRCRRVRRAVLMEYTPRACRSLRSFLSLRWEFLSVDAL